MSLVNDMLNDLEQRQRSSDAKPQLDVVPVGRGVVAQKKAWMLPLLVMGLVVILSAVSYQYWLHSDKTLIGKETNASAGDAQISLPKPLVVQQEINSLLIESYKSEENFQLVFIADKLAYQISPIDKSHLKIIIQDVSWIPGRLSLPDWLSEIHSAQSNDGVEITIKSSQPFSYQAQLEATDNKQKLAVVMKIITAARSQVQQEKTAKRAIKSDIVKPAAFAAVKKPRALTPSQLDRKASAEAQQLIRRGSYQQAEQKLWPIVDGYSGAKESRVTLVTLLLGQQRYQLAEQQLNIGLKNHPQERRLLKLDARLSMAQGKLENARDSLLKLSVNLSVDSEHVELLAAIYQRLVDHQQALKLYHQLVLFDAEQSSWWVGLGVSMEALGQLPNARAAYLRASRLPVESEALKQYISQRLAAIPADTKG